LKKIRKGVPVKAKRGRVRGCQDTREESLAAIQRKQQRTRKGEGGRLGRSRFEEKAPSKKPGTYQFLLTF